MQSNHARVRHRSPKKAEDNTSQPVIAPSAKAESKKSTSSGKSKASKKGEDKTSSSQHDKEADKKPDQRHPDQNHNGMTPFTPEQDAELLEMKLQGKSWKMIADQLGKYPGQCKHRYKDLQAEAAVKDSSKTHSKSGKNDEKDSKKDEKGDNKSVKGSKESDRNDEKHSKNDEKGENKSVKSSKKSDTKPDGHKSGPDHVEAWQKFKAAQDLSSYKKAPSRAASVAPTVLTTTTNSGTLFMLTEDDMFSYDDLQLLVDVLGADNNRLWDRVASAFFNKTGRRVLPGDIKAKIGPMVAGR